jgi:hypothetical protein
VPAEVLNSPDCALNKYLPKLTVNINTLKLYSTYCIIKARICFKENLFFCVLVDTKVIFYHNEFSEEKLSTYSSLKEARIELCASFKIIET